MANYEPKTKVDIQPRKRNLKDGNGNTTAYYIADVMIDGKQYRRKFSVNRYGVTRAKTLASLRREMWLLEHRVIDAKPKVKEAMDRVFNNLLEKAKS